MHFTGHCVEDVVRSRKGIFLEAPWDFCIKFSLQNHASTMHGYANVDTPTQVDELTTTIEVTD